MTTFRQNNLNRAACREKCRQKLSKHICTIPPSSGEYQVLTKSEVTNLGISIEPAEVRLITRAGDPYTWRILPEKQYLFEKHLSKHSIGAYRELCQEVGISFEAVLTPQLSNAAG